MNGIGEMILGKLYILPAVIIALSFHEWAHAFAAYKMGDPTARNLGRMTINPLAHIDILGFIMMLIVGFGWAKPVPVNPRNYRNYKKGEIVVSLAGVTMNLIIAVVFAFVYGAVVKYALPTFLIGGSGSALRTILNYFVLVNLCLLVFNLIPIYPLDGFHVAEVLISKHIGPKPFIFLKQYGQFILIGIILLGGTGFSFVGWAANGLYSGLMKLVAAALGIA